MSELRTFYIRDEKRNPMGCVVYDTRPGEIEFAISAVHKDDKPHKKFGRAIALQRYLKGATLVLILGDGDKVCGPKAHIMRHIVNAQHRKFNMGAIYPKRIISGAKRWLAAKPTFQNS